MDRVSEPLFGTFRNPRHQEHRCGFGEGESELLALLAGRDVASRHAEGVHA